LSFNSANNVYTYIIREESEVREKILYFFFKGKFDHWWGGKFRPFIEMDKIFVYTKFYI